MKRRPKVTCRSSRPEYDEQGRVSPETHRAKAERRLVLANQRYVSGVSGPQRLHLPSCGLRLGRAAANAPRRHAPAAHLCKPVHSVQFGHVRRLWERCVALGTARDAAVPPPTGPVQLRCGTQLAPKPYLGVAMSEGHQTSDLKGIGIVPEYAR